MRTRDRRREVLLNILTVAIFISVIAGVYFGLRFYLSTDTPLLAIASGSMEPALKVGDLLAIQGAQTRNIHNGDIIAFKQPDGNVTIVHRVVASRENSNATIDFKTKGDANNGEDPYWVPQGNVHGRVISGVPYIGFLILNPTLTLGLAVSIFIVLLSWPEKTKNYNASRTRHRRRN